jgi:adenylosuccinate lyase
VIPRYTPAEFLALWSPARRFAVWLDVELAACEAMEDAKLVPAGTAAAIRAKNLALSPDRIDEIERTTKHDVIAFLTHVEELAGIEACSTPRWRCCCATRPTCCSPGATR